MGYAKNRSDWPHTPRDVMADEIDRLSTLASKLDAQLSVRPCRSDQCRQFAELHAKAKTMDEALADLLDGEDPYSLHDSTGLSLDRCRQLCALNSLGRNSA